VGAIRPVRAASRTFTVTIEKKQVAIGGGMRFDGWTYNGTIPGPELRVNQGDDVEVKLINHTTDAHGINVHVAQIAPRHFGGQSSAPVTYRFRATTPGVFLYHCTAIPILDHIGRGMYGPVIVDPKNGWPSGPAQEITLVQSEFYGLPDAKGLVIPAHMKMLRAQPDFVVFNGELNKYGAQNPIRIKVGKLVRVFFVNAGPDVTSAFHVAGAIFSSVYQGGNPDNPLHGVDNAMIAPGGGALFEFTVREPGDYQFMDLERAHQYNGAMGVFRAER
jgi:nitrite reductase (NO-forming)